MTEQKSPAELAAEPNSQNSDPDEDARAKNSERYAGHLNHPHCLAGDGPCGSRRPPIAGKGSPIPHIRHWSCGEAS
jgi:hypothetical protein